MRRRVGNVEIECIQGNIAAQSDVDAVVNAANAQLMPGGGVAGAIHRAAGPKLAEECRPLAPISPGQAVITAGHDLASRWVIHCLGPVYGRDEPAAELLANCYRNALTLADKQKIGSIAFPAISTGVFGYPPAEAAAVALGAVLECAPRLKSVKRIRFVLFDDASLKLHDTALERLTDSA